MAELKCYRATVELLVRAEVEGAACDLMSTLLTENGMFSEDEQRLLDWAYSYSPTEIEVPRNEQGQGYFYGVDVEPATKGKVFRPGVETPAPVVAWLTSDKSIFLNFREAAEHEDHHQRHLAISEFCGKHGLAGSFIEAWEVEQALMNYGDELREILNR